MSGDPKAPRYSAPRERELVTVERGNVHDRIRFVDPRTLPQLERPLPGLPEATHELTTTWRRGAGSSEVEPLPGMSAARFDEILGATLATLRDNIEGESDQVERDEQGSMIDWIDLFIRGRSIARSLTEHAQRLAGPLSERERAMLVKITWSEQDEHGWEHAAGEAFGYRVLIEVGPRGDGFAWHVTALNQSLQPGTCATRYRARAAGLRAAADWLLIQAVHERHYNPVRPPPRVEP